jgi:hypothetical protein
MKILFSKFYHGTNLMTPVASGVDCMMNLGLSGEKGKTMLSGREITKKVIYSVVGLVLQDRGRALDHCWSAVRTKVFYVELFCSILQSGIYTSSNAKLEIKNSINIYARHKHTPPGWKGF